MRKPVLARAVYSLLAGTAVLLVATRHAEAQTRTIDFNDGTPDAAIGGRYASSFGVVLSNARFTSFFGCCGFSSLDISNQPQPSSPVVATFASPVGGVSLLGQDVGAAGFLLRAFDATSGGTLLATAQTVGTGIGTNHDQRLNITTAGIRRVEISQLTFALRDGIVFDDLSFTASSVAPEPSTYALLATGLGGIGVLARSRRRARV